MLDYPPDHQRYGVVHNKLPVGHQTPWQILTSRRVLNNHRVVSEYRLLAILMICIINIYYTYSEV